MVTCHKKSQAGLEEAEHTSLTKVPTSAESGPEMFTFRGPSASTVRDDEHRTINQFSGLTLQILILNHKRRCYVLTVHQKVERGTLMFGGVIDGHTLVLPVIV